MLSDCDQRRSSIKSLRSASLFESATSIVHPLESSVEIVEFDSLDTPAHAYRSSTSASSTYYTANNPADCSGISEEHKR